MWGPILAWLRKQVGQRTDTASVTGSVHAKLAYLLFGSIYASDTVQITADTERGVTTEPSGTYEHVKTIIVTMPGTIRTVFDMKSVGTYSGDAYGKIYKNDSPVGTARTTASSTYQTYTEDLAVAAGDRIQLYAYNNNTLHTTYVRNFRVCGELVSGIGIATLD